VDYFSRVGVDSPLEFVPDPVRETAHANSVLPVPDLVVEMFGLEGRNARLAHASSVRVMEKYKPVPPSAREEHRPEEEEGRACCLVRAAGRQIEQKAAPAAGSGCGGWAGSSRGLGGGGGGAGICHLNTSSAPCESRYGAEQLRLTSQLAIGCRCQYL
jgi:hypothetical protein